jgi:3-phosphoshikimate 1-carboxyvinyltransferase
MIERPGDVSRKEDLPLRQADQDLICYAFLPEGRALSGGDYMMPGHISSQYITGLLMALPLIGEDSRIVVTTELQSRSYIDITLGVLRDFGIDIKVEEKMAGYPVYHIKGGQKYSVPNGSASRTLRPEGDWSNAAFWLTAQALGSDIHVSGLNDASAQGDRAISEILERFRLRSDDPSDDPVIIDAGNIPDLVPVISVMASLSPGQTRIVNAGRLRIKESDRLKTTAAMLCALGADISETKDGLIIHGKTQLAGGTADGAGDHRIVMSAAIAATCCSEPVTILGAQASAKSYPAFFEHYRRAGGEFFER